MFNYGNTFDKDYMKPHQMNDLPGNFIQGYYLSKEDEFIIEAIRHASNGAARPHPTIVPTSNLTDPKLLDVYTKLITKITNNYYKKFEPASCLGAINLEQVLIQKFEKLNGRGISIEKNRGWNVSSRHLGYMTFLNDVTDEGTINWYYQGLQIKPEKGLTIVFPCNWTYIHSISPSPTQESMIISSWSRFNENSSQNGDGVPRIKLSKPKGTYDYNDPVKYDFDDLLDGVEFKKF